MFGGLKRLGPLVFCLFLITQISGVIPSLYVEALHEYGRFDATGTAALPAVSNPYDQPRQHQPGTENHDCGEDAVAHAGRGNCGRTQSSNHHGVDESHAHPADFGEDDGDGETEKWTKLGRHVTRATEARRSRRFIMTSVSSCLRGPWLCVAPKK